MPTQLNTSQHESTRVNTNQHKSTRIEYGTNQHESDSNQQESTRVRNESMQVNKSKKVKRSPRRVNASQQKLDMSLTRIWESITNCRNISREVFIYVFSFLVQCLHCTWQLRCRRRFCMICLLFTLVWSLHWIGVIKKRFFNTPLIIEHILMMWRREYYLKSYTLYFSRKTKMWCSNIFQH